MTPISAAPKLVWDNILTLPYYQPGKPIEEVERELGLTGIVKLASNENPLGPSPKATEAMHKAAASMHRYPDANGFYLKDRLGTLLDVHRDQIGLGNGADELLTLVAAAFIHPGDEALIPSPTFIRYETAVQMMGGTPVRVPLRDWTIDFDALTAAVTERTKLVFICNPNNPTGTYVDERRVRAFLDAMPRHVIFVFDEAYREYVDALDFPDSLAFLRSGDRRIIVMRTFSKIYGLAGLRIGYGIATPELSDVLKLVRLPFNASAMAQAAALAALDDTEHVERSQQLNRQGKRFVYDLFDRLSLTYAPSQTNFVFFDSRRDGVQVFDALLRRGVIIRPLTVQGTKRYLRVSIGTPSENERFAEALEAVLADIPPIHRD